MEFILNTGRHGLHRVFTLPAEVPFSDSFKKVHQ